MNVDLTESQKADSCSLVESAGRVLDRVSPADLPVDGAAALAIAAFRKAADALRCPTYTVLISGLRSVGKSTFVSALWGDADLLPTAVRDCTQTNTLIRTPGEAEDDRALLLSYLRRDEAVEFASRGLAYYRLAQMLAEALGPMGPKLDELPPEERLRAAVRSVRNLFAEQKAVFVLYEHLTEQLDQLEEFLAFLDSPQYAPGEVVAAEWDMRREHLMGRRRADGRTLDVGKLLALRHVEVVRETPQWQCTVPRLIDTPWIPTFHNARRSDLIQSQAKEADVLVVISLPETYVPEEWLQRVLRERAGIAQRSILIFNQVDTIDRSQVHSRGGFAEAYAETCAEVGALGFKEENVLLSCSRLPYLVRGERDAFLDSRLEKLRDVLAHIRRLATDGRSPAFKGKLLAACDPEDAGLESLRMRLDALWRGPVMKARVTGALASVSAVEMDVFRDESTRSEWSGLAERAKRIAGGIW
jgi:hypothetical protein